MAENDQLFARFGRSCAPGTLLFREGDEGTTMFVLQSGRVRISKESEDGARTLALLGPGDFFGEMAILNRKPRTASAEVVEHAQLLVLDAKTFEAMVLSNAEIAVLLIQKLARRLDNADALIEILLHRDPKARVILGLSREAEHAGVDRGDGSVLVPLTREGLATQVGLGTDAVAEVLARLTRLRIVRETPEGFVIEDVLRLSEFLEFLQMREKFAEV